MFLRAGLFELKHLGNCLIINLLFFMNKNIYWIGYDTLNLQLINIQFGLCLSQVQVVHINRLKPRQKRLKRIRKKSYTIIMSE